MGLFSLRKLNFLICKLGGGGKKTREKMDGKVRKYRALLIIALIGLSKSINLSFRNSLPLTSFPLQFSQFSQGPRAKMETGLALLVRLAGALSAPALPSALCARRELQSFFSSALCFLPYLRA